MKQFFKAPKTVASVLAGFQQVANDLREVIERNVARAAEGNARIAEIKAQAEARISEEQSAIAYAESEIQGAQIALENITNLIGDGTPPSNIIHLQAAE